MIQQHPVSTQVETRQIKVIINIFKQMYENQLEPQKVQEIFHACLDQSFAKNKTTLTQNQVESIYDSFKVAANQHPISIFYLDQIATVSNSCVKLTNLQNYIQDPLENIKKTDNMRDYLPFGISQFLHIVHINTFIRRAMFPDQFYHYVWHNNWPLQFMKCLQNTGTTAFIFYKVISFNWIQARCLFQKAINESQQFKIQYQSLFPVFDKIKYIEQKVKQKKKLEDYYLLRGTQNKRNASIIKKQQEKYQQVKDEINEIDRQLQLLSIFCENLQVKSDPYMQSILYFLVFNKYKPDYDFKGIMNNPQLPQVVKYYFGVTFLPDPEFQEYKLDLDKRVRQLDDFKYLLFTKGEQLKTLIQHQIQYKQQIQKASLIGLLVFGKEGNFKKKKHIFSEILETYLNLIKFNKYQQTRINFTMFYHNINDNYGDINHSTTFSKQIFQICCLACGTVLNFGFNLKSNIHQYWSQKEKSVYSYENNFDYSNQKVQSDPDIFKYQCDCKMINSSCYVCLKPINMYNFQTYYNDEIKKQKKQKKNYADLKQAFDSSLVYCPKCEHGGHFAHILEWQEKYPETCGVFNCPCKCKF